MSDNSKEGGMYKSVAAVFFISMFCRVFGFLREIAIGAWFPAVESDAYFMAIKIFNIFALLFGYMWTTSYTPLYTHAYKADDSRKLADRLTSNLLNILLLISVSLTVLCEIFVGPICDFIATGFTGDKLQMTIRMTQIVLPAIPFFGMYYFFSAVLNAQKKFKIVEAATAFVGLGVILSIVCFKWLMGPYSIALGALLAYVLQFIVMLPSVMKSFKYQPVLTFKEEKTKEFFRLLAPSAIGVAAAEINSVIDSALASTLSDGNVTSLNFALRINTFATSLLVTPIITVLFTRLSEYVANGEKKGFEITLRNGMETLGVICIPITALVAVASEDVVRIVYQHGQFSEESVGLTTAALFFYIIGLIFYGFKTLLNRAFYAHKNTKTPMITGFIYIGLNVLLNFLLIGPMGVGGLALANTIALFLATVVMIIAYIYKYGKWNMEGSAREFAIMIFGAALCILVYLGLRHVLYSNLYLRFFIPCGAGVLVYAAVARIFKVRQFMELWNMVISKFIKKR